MITTLFASAALMLAVPDAPDDITIGGASDIHSVNVDGELVRYRAATDADGHRHVWGERVSDGATFHFRVDESGRGQGAVGAKKVKFRVR